MKSSVFSISFSFIFLVLIVGHTRCYKSLIKSELDQVVIRNLIVYGSDTCHYCIATKAHLKENNVAFEYFDIDKNEAKLREMLANLEKSNIPIQNLVLPIVDKNGLLLMNDGDFEKFLEKLTLNK